MTNSNSTGPRPAVLSSTTTGCVESRDDRGVRPNGRESFAFAQTGEPQHADHDILRAKVSQFVLAVIRQSFPDRSILGAALSVDRLEVGATRDDTDIIATAQARRRG